jgi:hypothetical protein
MGPVGLCGIGLWSCAFGVLWACVARAASTTLVLMDETYFTGTASTQVMFGSRTETIVLPFDGTEVADCCSSRPLFRIVLPPVGDRHDEAELFMCRHHMRAGLSGLNAANALIYDEIGTLAWELAIADFTA